MDKSIKKLVPAYPKLPGVLEMCEVDRRPARYEGITEGTARELVYAGVPVGASVTRTLR